MSPLELAHKPSPRQALTIQLPLKEGVSPSCVALSNGSWGLVLEFLVQRLPAVSHAVWLQRMAEGWVLDATGMAIKPSATCDDLRMRTGQVHPRIYYYRQLAFEPVIPLSGHTSLRTWTRQCGGGSANPSVVCSLTSVARRST
jgi:hypothetical protein